MLIFSLLCGVFLTLLNWEGYLHLCARRKAREIAAECKNAEAYEIAQSLLKEYEDFKAGRHIWMISFFLVSMLCVFGPMRGWAFLAGDILACPVAVFWARNTFLYIEDRFASLPFTRNDSSV